jgi:hypothetical protein
MTPTEKEMIEQSAHEQKRHMMEMIHADALRMQGIDERESMTLMTVDEVTDYYDQFVPHTKDAQVILAAVEAEIYIRRSERIAQEPSRQGQRTDLEPPGQCSGSSSIDSAARARMRVVGKNAAAAREYVQAEVKANRKATHRGIVRHAQTAGSHRKASPKKAASKPGWSGGQARSEDHHQRILAGLEKAADGQPRSDRELQRLVGCAPDDFIRFVRFIPWATMTRTHAPTSTMFTIDQEFRDICERRIPRPALAGQSIQNFLRHLRAEIIRRRKENNDERRRVRWNSDAIMSREQTDLLNWIETELDRVPA